MYLQVRTHVACAGGAIGCLVLDARHACSRKPDTLQQPIFALRGAASRNLESSIWAAGDRETAEFRLSLCGMCKTFLSSSHMIWPCVWGAAGEVNIHCGAYAGGPPVTYIVVLHCIAKERGAHQPSLHVLPGAFTMVGTVPAA